MTDVLASNDSFLYIVKCELMFNLENSIGILTIYVGY